MSLTTYNGAIDATDSVDAGKQTAPYFGFLAAPIGFLLSLLAVILIVTALLPVLEYESWRQFVHFSYPIATMLAIPGIIFSAITAWLCRRYRSVMVLGIIGLALGILALIPILTLYVF